MFEKWIEDGTLEATSEKYDNAVSIAEKEDAADETTAEEDSDDLENPENKPAGEEPPTGEDGLPLKPGE